jgi:hypothetical protein
MLGLKFFLVFLPILYSCASAQEANGLKIFNEREQLRVYGNHDQAKGALDYLNLHVGIMTDQKVKYQLVDDETEATVLFIKNERLEESDFLISTETGVLTIESNSTQGFVSGVNHLFIHGIGYIPYRHKISQFRVNEAFVASDFAFDSRKYKILYKEPYFIENYQKDFSEIHRTDNLENHWLIWGHNIPKVIQISPEMLAKVDGEQYEDQLCFSSPELKSSLEKFLNKALAQGESRRKVMITPLDDVHACTCERCRELGNTKLNASPAVFSLINELAERFETFEFFGTAYHSTKLPPDFGLHSDVGVMFTSMDFDKGVRYEFSRNAEKWKGELATWKKQSNKLFLWDYLIHFDNYFSSYPIQKIAQANIKWLQTLGVNGFFLHGTDVSYAAFSDLKAFLTAESLNNPDMDFDRMVTVYFRNYYPGVAELLSKYYLSIENRSLNSAKTLDIYGSWQADVRKYLDFTELSNVLGAITERYKSLPKVEQIRLNPLLSALYYQKLELQRSNGKNEFGFLTQKDGEWKVKESVISDFNEFKKFTFLSKLSALNESGLTIQSYIGLFEHRIIQADHNNELLGLIPVFLKTPDEDYAQSRVLTDGARGFSDYFNNWLLNYSTETHVKIALSQTLKGKHQIEIGLLESKRHKIGLPESITLKIGSRVYNFPNSEFSNVSDSCIYQFVAEIELNGEKEIEIILNKSAEGRKLATGCDEIKIVKTKTM